MWRTCPAQSIWHVGGQRAVDQPIKDAVPVRGIRDDVPPLIALRGDPRRDHRSAERVDENRLEVAVGLVVGGWATCARLQGDAADLETPPRRGRGPVEQPKRKVSVGMAQ